MSNQLDDLTLEERTELSLREALVDLLDFLRHTADSVDPRHWDDDLLPISASVLLLIYRSKKCVDLGKWDEATTALNQGRLLMVSLVD